MFSFMQWSFVEYERSAPGSSVEPTLVRVANWLTNTALFEQAWKIVCDGPLKWWWSEQLCLFTVGFWTVFLLTKGTYTSVASICLTYSDRSLDDLGREYRVKHVWAYMLFGQLVAISVGINLFFLALPPTASARATEIASTKRTVPPLLWLSVLASLGTVFLVPRSLQHDYFLLNLLVMHALLVIPLLPLRVAPTGSLHIRTRALYQLIALLAVIARVRTTLSMNTTGAVAGQETVWAVLHSHPAQASIGWDVVWTTISFLMWIRPAVQGQLMVILASGLWSIGTSAPLYFWAAVET